MYKPCRTVVLFFSEPFSVAFTRPQTIFLTTVEYSEEIILRQMEKLLKDYTLFIFFTDFIHQGFEFTELEILRLIYCCILTMCQTFAKYEQIQDQPWRLLPACLHFLHTLQVLQRKHWGFKL